MYTAASQIFVYYILPIAVITIGLPANLFALSMFIRNGKKLDKIGPLFMYRLMFGIDTTFLFSAPIFLFLGRGFQLSFYLISDLSYKLYFYIIYASFTFSPLILLYISLNRFISIKYYAKRMLLKKSKYQYWYVFCFVLFNFIYNIPAYFEYTLFNNSETNKTECNLFGENPKIIS